MIQSSFNITNFELCRKTMINTQLRPNNIQEDTILKAFRSIPREKFLPMSLRSLAYSDSVLHYDKENILLSPLFLGRFLKVLKVGEFDSILVVGDRTGYTSALFSVLAGGAVLLLPSSLPSQEQDQIQKNLMAYAFNPVIVKTGDLKNGFLTHAPYTYIFIDGGSIPSIPSSYVTQVEEHGKIAAFIKTSSYLAKASVFQKKQGKLFEDVLFETTLPSLPALQGAPSFSL